MIRLQVNGHQVDLEAPLSILAYLGQIGANPNSLAVELNGQILPRDGYSSTEFKTGDRVEIIRMVGGGSRPPQRPAASI
ncbi:MAG TPA: sulfur carrier protein ThiS [Candidatus Acidoferrales bacterium]|nr:sulfur carrier protein ThiS [Candidatus Acidoferrales bacterium]